MNGEHLIQYMKAVCDAEGILYACSGILATWNLEKAFPAAQQIQAQTERQLRRLYDCAVLLPPYRNLIAVNQLCEYLETGICTELEGDYGAYAAYQWDVQIGQICTTVTGLKRSAGRDARLTRIGLSVVAMKQGRALREIQAADRLIRDLSQEESPALRRHPYIAPKLRRLEICLTRKTCAAILQSSPN